MAGMGLPTNLNIRGYYTRANGLPASTGCPDSSSITEVPTLGKGATERQAQHGRSTWSVRLGRVQFRGPPQRWRPAASATCEKRSRQRVIQLVVGGHLHALPLEPVWQHLPHQRRSSRCKKSRLGRHQASTQQPSQSSHAWQRLASSRPVVGGASAFASSASRSRCARARPT